MEKTDVTVIVPTHRCAKTLPTFLAHLELQSHPAARIEIIIADLGSSDATAEVAQRYADGAPIRARCLQFGAAQAGEALSAAVDAAEGRWLVFLHQNLLAGTHLIREHIRAQERHGGGVVVRGLIERHPQTALPGMVNPFPMRRDSSSSNGAGVAVTEWRLWNLSMPRGAVVDAGNFSPAFPFPAYAGVELGTRLQARGIEGHYAADAPAYVWFVPELDEERSDAYARGYCRSVLLNAAHSAELRERFPVDVPGAVHRARAVLHPLWLLAANAGGSGGFLYRYGHRQVLRHAMGQGLRDAICGNSPELPV